MVEQLINNIAEVTLSEVAWLEQMFAVVTIQTTSEGPQPFAYLGQGEYVSVLPDDRFKAFGYLELKDPITFTNDRSKRYVFNVDMVIWLDTEKILDMDSTKTPDSARTAVLESLQSPNHRTTTLEVLRVFEVFDNIYGKYKVSQKHTQFMMRPYYAFKVELKVTQRDKPC